MEEPIEIFISYAHRDEPLKQRLVQHLMILQRQGIINTWHDHQINAGDEWEQAIDAHLNSARIILLLISPDFLASDYCYSIEMERAMKRHEHNEARVIPIILRPVYLPGTPFSKLQVLPKDAKPVTSRRHWDDLDDALYCVAEGIHQAIQSLPPPKIVINQPERLPEVSPTHLLRWSVPFARNPYFTGREKLLEQLHTSLTAHRTESSIHKEAITGLGGIGKTQIALEYAYQYCNHYTTVFWVRADSRETLLSDFTNIRSLVDTKRLCQQTPNMIINSVKYFFHKHKDWLLIFDNIADITTVQEFLPTFGNGSIIITCRMQSLGQIVPYPVEVNIMELEEGTLFLLRRTGVLRTENALDTVSEDNRNFARTLVKEMDGLPLALDQAGAYIQKTSCSLDHYLKLYQKYSAKLHEQGGKLPEYPYNVATTWSLSFQNVEKDNPIATEMLRLCAFLHPDAIPEEIFTEGRDGLGPVLSTIVDDPFALDDAIGTLRQYSLVKRNTDTNTLTIHRLVQTVLRDVMNPEQRRLWAERTIHVINRLFPKVKRGPVNMDQWPDCEKYLSHAQVCLTLTEQYTLTLLDAACLFYRVGCYLYQRGRYTEARPFCEHTSRLREQMLGLEHTDVAESLDLLAAIYHKQGKYAEEEPLFQRVIAYREKVQGPEHLDLAKSLHGLGKLYYRQGKYAKAESVLQRARSIFRKDQGTENPNVLSLLGLVNSDQEKYAAAEPLFQQALTIFEQDLGPMHPDVGNSLTRLGILYKAQGKYTEALLVYQRALSILEQTLGPEHRDIAISLNNIGGIYYLQGKYTEVEPLWQRARTIFEKVLGPEHDHVGTILNHLGDLAICQEKYAEAEQYLQRALTIHQKSLGLEHFRTINDLDNLENLYTRQEKYTEAEQLLLQALDLYEKTFGPEHPAVAEILSNLGALYQKQGKEDEARSHFQQALTLQKKVLGPDHPQTLATQEQYQSL